MDTKLSLRDRMAIRLLLVIARFIASDPALQQEIIAFRNHIAHGKEDLGS